MMTAELNNQRVSYYTGVKLIRHHHQSANSSGNTGGGTNPASGFFHPHHHHHPPHPLFPPHHPSQHHPPLHHPGHFHLPCPTGPAHLQHPGPLHSAGVLLSPSGPPPHHSHHHNHPHNYNGGGSYSGTGGGGGNGNPNNTRLYTGSPLIRSSAYHSVPGGGNSKRVYKQSSRGHHNSSNKNGVNQHHINQLQNNGGGSCSSGTSSSSSSNEHLNNIVGHHHPSSPTHSSKSLDISPLTLSSSPSSSGSGSPPRYEQIGGSSPASSTLSTNSSSPGPDSPGLKLSPSPTSTLSSSSSSSPHSGDGNKDLDHFYFLDEHWKPSSDGSFGETGRGADMMMMNMIMGTSGNSGSQWNNSVGGSSGSSSPLSSSTSAMTMMVDQIFGQVGDGDGSNPGDGGGGGIGLRDSNNNLVGQPDFNEMVNNSNYPRNLNVLSGFENHRLHSNRGTSGLINFGGTTATTKFGNSSVVNVETQIGTFNGQRDLEIRLCFIKGDHNKETATTTGGQHQLTNHYLPINKGAGFGDMAKNMKMTSAVIGDPFINSSNNSTATSTMPMIVDNHEGDSDEPSSDDVVPRSNEIVQQS